MYFFLLLRCTLPPCHYKRHRSFCKFGRSSYLYFYRSSVSDIVVTMYIVNKCIEMYYKYKLLWRCRRCKSFILFLDFLSDLDRLLPFEDVGWFAGEISEVCLVVEQLGDARSSPYPVYHYSH